MTDEKPEILLVGPPKPTIVNGLAPFTVHRLGEAKDRGRVPCRYRPARARHRVERHVGKDRCRPDDETAAARDRRYFRRRLRSRRCGLGGGARHHRHQHAAGADRGGCRHGARPPSLHRARIPAGGALSARRQMGGARLSAHQGDAARPHGWYRGYGRHRPGHRAPARRHARCRSSTIRAVRQRTCVTATIPS